MELRHLRSFVAVAEELSFTRAAERLHLAQPALSVQMRQLEAAVGVALIDRSRRAISLTTAGALMLTETRRLLSMLDQTLDVVRRTGTGLEGRISIGFVPSTANHVLPPLLRSFAASHPDVAVHLREMGPDELVRALHVASVDLGFLYLPFEDPTLARLVVSREPYIVAIPDGNPLVRNATIDIALLRDEPFVLPSRRTVPGLHGQVLDICTEAGFAPRAIHDDVWLIQTVVGLVAAGLGVALVPASTQHIIRRGVVYRPLTTDGDHHAELAAVWHRDHLSPPLERFLLELDGGRGDDASRSVNHD